MQMLLVEHPVASEQDAIATDKPFNIEDYIYPHGLTPPLRHVRRRRFKPQLNKQAIEITERQVERLLELDEHAEETQYEMVDESEIQEDDAQRTQAQYQAEFAGIDMDLDPALMGANAAATAAATNAAAKPVDGTDMQAAASTSGTAGTTVAGSIANGVPPAQLDGHGDTTAPFEDSFMTNGDSETTTLKLGGHSRTAAAAAAAAGDDEDDGSGDDDDHGEEYNGEEDEEDDSDAEGYDSDLAAMIEGGIQGSSSKAGNKAGGAGAATSASGAGQTKKKGDSDASGGSDDDDDDEGDSDDLFGKGRSDDEDDDDANAPLGDSSVMDNEETLEAKRRIRLMADEMKDLEKAVSNKRAEHARAPNPMLKKRFGDVLNKLQSELELKKAQHQAAQNRLQMAQNEIKRQEAEEHAAANPQPATSAAAPAGADAQRDGSVDEVASGDGNGNSNKTTKPKQQQQPKRAKADPSVVFGGGSSASKQRPKAGGDSMQIDDGSRSQSPLPSNSNSNSGRAGNNDNDNDDADAADDDIAVTSKDYAVPGASGADGGGIDDLFGDGADD